MFVNNHNTSSLSSTSNHICEIFREGAALQNWPLKHAVSVMMDDRQTSRVLVRNSNTVCMLCLITRNILIVRYDHDSSLKYKTCKEQTKKV